ncbi:cupin domain-containing protein [Streptomyces sp. NPDC001984]
MVPVWNWRGPARPDCEALRICHLRCDETRPVFGSSPSGARSFTSWSQWRRRRQAVGRTDPREDEIFMLIKGTALLWSDDQEKLPEGGIVYLPKNVPHGYRITSDTADLLMICTPGGIEGMFRHAGRGMSTARPDDLPAHGQRPAPGLSGPLARPARPHRLGLRLGIWTGGRVVFRHICLICGAPRHRVFRSVSQE